MTSGVTRIATAISVAALIVACGGRVADPVPDYRPGDDDMTCPSLRAEMSHINSEVSKLIPESKKTGKNVALGAAGLFLIFPWFFMDVGDAEKVEIRAYNERYLALEKLHEEKCTGDKDPGVTEAPSTESVKDRLKLLEELKAEGLITEDEYEVRRQEILMGV